MKHVQNTICLVSLLFFLTLNPTQAQTIVGNGKVVKQDRAVKPFTAIDTSNGWDIILTQGNTHKMTIEADENFLEHLATEVNNGVLKIYSKARLRHYNKNSKNKIYLTFKNINSITASSGADISATTTITADNFKLRLSSGSDLEKLNLKAKNLDGVFASGSDATINFSGIQHINVEASGGSDINFDNISGEKLQLNLRGGSDANLKGIVNQFTVTANGGSDIEAGAFKVNNCQMELSGSSDASIEVNGEMQVSLSGGSDLNCKGNPKITSQNVCKSCDFIVRK